MSNIQSVPMKILRYILSKINILNSVYYGLPADGPVYTIEVTYRCNAKCKFCSRWKLNNKQEMTLEEYENIALQLNKCKVKQVVLSGGEPFIRRDILEIAQIFKKHGIRVAVDTNGTLIQEFSIDKVKEVIDSVLISLDSPYAEVQDQHKGIPGSFEKIISAIKVLKRNDIKVIIGALISSATIRGIDEYIKLANKLGVGYRFQLMQCEHDNMLSLNDYKLKLKIEDQIFLKEALNRIITNSRSNWAERIYYRLMPIFSMNNSILKNGKCFSAARLKYFIDPKGSIVPCEGRRDIVLGNLLQEKLYNIINSNKTVQIRKRLFSGKDGCFCLYRCHIFDNIEYQYLPLFPLKSKNGWPIKNIWDKRINNWSAEISKVTEI